MLMTSAAATEYFRTYLLTLVISAAAAESSETRLLFGFRVLSLGF